MTTIINSANAFTFYTEQPNLQTIIRDAQLQGSTNASQRNDRYTDRPAAVKEQGAVSSTTGYQTQQLANSSTEAPEGSSPASEPKLVERSGIQAYQAQAMLAIPLVSPAYLMPADTPLMIEMNDQKVTSTNDTETSPQRGRSNGTRLVDMAA
jgi:hypothetical protein